MLTVDDALAPGVIGLPVGETNIGAVIEPFGWRIGETRVIGVSNRGVSAKQTIQIC